MKGIAEKDHGPLGWLKNRDYGKIKAFWGSVEEFENSSVNWQDISIGTDPVPERISHGWDESKPDSEIGIYDAVSAASFRGGRCLSPGMKKGDLFTPLEWECSMGHRFTASPYLVLKSGHWCPECDIDPFRYEETGEKNIFLSQVL